MRINITAAVTVSYILSYHIEHNICFTRTSLANDVKMPHSVLARYANDGIFASVIVYPQDYPFLPHFKRSGSNARFCLFQLRLTADADRKMEHGRELF